MRTLTRLLLAASLTLFYTTANAQSCQAQSNGDLLCSGDGSSYYPGASLRIEGGRSGERTDIILRPRGGYSTPTGKVYMGSSASVRGTLWAKRVEITDPVPWPDYVFEDDYRLRPLSEVESYINEHGHLPDVPPAAEFENGYDLAEIDGSLMKKVEELTLYVIRQEQRIKELESRLDE